MTLKGYLEQNYTTQTVDSYLRAINHFLFHSKQKGQSTYSDVIEYLNRENKASPRNLSAIKVYFNYLIDMGKREDHPCRSLKAKGPSRSVQFQELFTKDELERLLKRKERYAMLSDRNKAILSLLIYQGLTPANIENLRIQDIDLDGGTVYIRATSTIKRRRLELKSKQILLLYRYLSESRPKLLKKETDALFITKVGVDFNVESLNRMLRPLQGLFPFKNLNANVIRKSVITNWLNVDRIPLEDVQLLAGHKWLSTTEKYVRPNVDERREQINVFFPL